MNNRASTIMGVDVAWEGIDSSGFVIRQGLAIKDIQEWVGNDPYTTKNLILQRYSDSKYTSDQIDIICIDKIGIGAGVFSEVERELEGENVDVYGVNVNESCPDENYAKFSSWRDLLWWRQRRFFWKEKPYFEILNSKVHKLVDQLCEVKYGYDNRGKIKVQKKHELDKSPDLADMLGLTFYADYEIVIEMQENKKRDCYRDALENNDEVSWKII